MRARALVVACAVVAGVLAPATARAQVGPRCFGLEATIVGTAAAETLTGTDGPDVIVGFGGDDVIIAGKGDDVVCAGRGADVVLAGGGDDIVIGGPGADEIRGGRGEDFLSGTRGEDVLIGNAGVDTISGGFGNDLLFGNAGWDQCDVGRGQDRRVRCEEAIDASAGAPLAGATSGMSAGRALRLMTRAFGPPTSDTGWSVGCELDGTEPNERVVHWGSLYASFLDSDGSRSFIGWGYVSVFGVDDGGPQPGDVGLFGRAHVLGDALFDIASDQGEPIVSGLFGEGLMIEIFTGNNARVQVATSGNLATDTTDSVRVDDYVVCE